MNPLINELQNPNKENERIDNILDDLLESNAMSICWLWSKIRG